MADKAVFSDHDHPQYLRFEIIYKHIFILNTQIKVNIIIFFLNNTLPLLCRAILYSTYFKMVII